MWQRIREENLNVMLAELLSEYCLKAVGEVIIRRKMSDVLLNLNGVRIIIEGKNVGHREELYTNACRRIGSGLCDAVVMVEVVKLAPEKQIQLHISQKLIKQALKSGTFHVGFVTYVDRVGLGRWIPRMRKKPEFYENVDFQKLVAYLMITYDALVKEINRDKVLGYLGLLNNSNVPI
ncbi:MAG: hypothetical protein NWF13_03930 [Candidatus Bathyarchaeota archaeon]|nr:hypothetical protein [Candidatus Bathyarchaeota archaeon]